MQSKSFENPPPPWANSAFKCDQKPTFPELVPGWGSGFQLISALRLEAGPQPFEATEVLQSRSSKGRHNK